jgi:adenosylmethionine-8-amino-7-oxononanoate aminotransferase
MASSAPNPLLRPYSIPGSRTEVNLVRGTGCTVFDGSGRRYLDAAGGLWNVALGLDNRHVLDRIAAQGAKLGYATLFDQSHALSEKLAERLVGLSGGAMDYAYLSTTGSSAVDVALRLCRLHFRARGLPGKKRILSFDRGYHGCSSMGLSASGIVHEEMGDWEECLPGFQTLPSPADEAASLAAIRALFERERDSLCCLVMEPVLGSGGIIVPSHDYCRALSQLCHEADVLLVADEVATGGGRCGQVFASFMLGLEPDVIALAKGLTAGYFPLGATLFGASVVEPIRAANVQLLYGSTQDGNPAGCAAALATLELVESQGLCARATELGARIRDGLAPLTDGVVREIRGLGLMIGIDLVHGGSDRRAFTEQEAAEVRRLCRDQGLLVYHFHSGVSLFPALTMTDDEADELIDILGDVLGALI